MRFQPPSRRLAGRRFPGRRGFPSLRLAALLAGVLLVLSAQSHLRTPATQEALGRALGEPEAPTVAPASPDAPPPLVDPELLRTARDNAPFRNAERSAWFAVIDAVRRADPASLAGQSAGAVGYAQLISQPHFYRGRVVSVAGRVERVERVEPAENDLGLRELWRVTLAPMGGEVWPLTVYTLDAPGDAPPPYDASAVGVFFKKLSYRWSGGMGSTPVVVARRLERPVVGPTIAAGPTSSVPDAPFAAPTNGSMGRALLAELGFDLAMFESIVDRRPLAPEEAAAFYGLLRCVSDAPATQLARLASAGLTDYVARREAALGHSVRDRQLREALRSQQGRGRYSVASLFGDGDAERGELVVFDAVVRRAVRVDAGDSAEAQRAGVAHYYELEAFPEDSQNLPLVFVVRELPKGFPVGDAIRQPARLAGVFLKQWAYRARRRGDGDADRRQFAPLLVGRAPIPLAAADPSAGRLGHAVGLLAAAATVAAAVAVWRLARGDRAYQAATLARFRRPDPAAIDFRRLELADHRDDR